MLDTGANVQLFKYLQNNDVCVCVCNCSLIFIRFSYANGEYKEYEFYEFLSPLKLYVIMSYCES